MHCKALWPGSELSNGMGSGVMLAISHMIFGVGQASKRSASSARKFDLVVAGEVMTGVGDERGGYEILHVGGDLSCGGRAATGNLSARRSLMGALDANGNRLDGLAHAEAGRGLGAGRRCGRSLRMHALRGCEAKGAVLHGIGEQLSALANTTPVTGLLCIRGRIDSSSHIKKTF